MPSCPAYSLFQKEWIRSFIKHLPIIVRFKEQHIAMSCTFNHGFVIAPGIGHDGKAESIALNAIPHAATAVMASAEAGYAECPQLTSLSLVQEHPAINRDS